MLFRTARLLAGLSGAVLLCQAPEYLQQYEQRLGGAAFELRLIVERFDQDARNSGLTREAALERYAESEDGFFRERGVSMRATVHRFTAISMHRERLAGAGPFARPVEFFSHADADVRTGALAAYRPAVPTTAEGALYGVVGFLMGGALWTLFGRLLRLLRRGPRPA